MNNKKFIVNVDKLRDYRHSLKNNSTIGVFDPCCDILELRENINEIKNPNYLRLPDSINLKFHLSSSFENLGLMTDDEKFSEVEPKIVTITGSTIDKLDIVKNYSGNIYSPYVNVSSDSTKFTGVIHNNQNEIMYIIDGEVQNNNYVGGTGIVYKTFTDFIENYDNGCGYSEEYYRTSFYVTKDSSDGFENNHLIGDCRKINISCPETVDNRIILDRGNESPLSKFCEVNQINSIEELVKYSNGNGFRFYEDY